jgi:hypothetical protein
MALTVFGGVAVSAATTSSAAYPPPCPTQPFVWQSDGNYYVSIPDATGQRCRDVVEVPLTIKKPATDAGAIPAPRPNACPPQLPVYQANGHDYVLLPDPSGKTCGTPYELPVTVPPM